MNSQKKTSINYIYFSIYFAFVSSIYIYYSLLIEPIITKKQILHLSIVELQTFTESIIIAYLFSFISRINKKIFLVLSSGFLMMISVIRILDFIMLRLMDISGWKFITLLAQETFKNFIELINLSGIKSTTILSLIVISILAGANFFIFLFTQKLCDKKPIQISFKKMSCYCLGGLSILGTLAYAIKDFDTPSYYAKALPWQWSFLCAKTKQIEVSNFLLPSKKMALDTIDSTLLPLERRPDIFLFVVESLRKDFLTEELTPTLANFSNNNYSFENALSNANSTHPSWFSLFYSLYPFYWTKYASPQWEQGAIPLSFLKKMGYEIHVYSSPSLEFYGMDQEIFGKNRYLVNHMNDFSSTLSTSPAEKDQMVIEKLCKDLQESSQKNGRLFILFLDGTHYPYSSLKTRKTALPSAIKDIKIPDIQHISLLKHVFGLKKGVSELQYHYKNALCAIDDLFKTFQETLNQTGNWEDSVIVFTGDHGEEFNESGCIFHTSHLSLPQLDIPLYVKLGKSFEETSPDCRRKASHIDVFPTLLHYLTGKNVWASFFQGESLLDTQKKDYTIGIRSNASLAPYEFYIQRGPYRATLEFFQREDIFHSQLLKIQSIVNEKEERISFSSAFFQQQFGEALDQLFPLQEQNTNK